MVDASKTDKAAAAKVEDKQDAAYKTYEAEQATHEKKHPGEIDERAYKKYEDDYDKAEAAKAGKASDAQKKYDAAHAEAVKLSEAAIEADAKAEKSTKTPEQIAAMEAHRKAGEAHAKAAALHPDANPTADSTLADVKPVKRSNDPANPAYAPGISTDDEDQTVRLWRTSHDHPSPVYTMVHPEMVGDYLRAGWSR